MCGILALLYPDNDAIPADVASQFDALVDVLTHRGPDGRGVVRRGQNFIVGHRRLSIVDVEHGAQPFEHTHAGEDIVLVGNGEIYNHASLRESSELARDFDYSSLSDNEVIIPLFLEHGFDMLSKLNGMFGFVLKVGGQVIAARDALGIKPLLMGTKGDAIWFSSEAKALMKVCDEVHPVPAGHYWTRETGFIRYFNPAWLDEERVPSNIPTSQGIYDVMKAAVERRLMADVPLGCFISGGLDSSLVAAYTRELLGPDAEIHSFSVAVEGGDSGDRVCSKLVAKHLGTIHHEATFTVQEGIDQVDKTIYQLETYDPCPLRSGVAMGFLCRLAAQYVKVCLTGEGADEVWAGYLYFGDASDKAALQRESVRKIKELPQVFLQFDDRLGMGSSLELRVPFLDMDLLEYAMNLDPASKMHGDGRMEKYILREACQKLLPKQVAWRRKEQFGDGVGYSWIDSLKAHWETAIPDSQFELRAKLFPDDTPQTKEGFYYRDVFERHFPLKSARKLVIQWFPWSDPTNHESSGRQQASHVTKEQEAEA